MKASKQISNLSGFLTISYSFLDLKLLPKLIVNHLEIFYIENPDLTLQHKIWFKFGISKILVIPKYSSKLFIEFSAVLEFSNSGEF